MVKKTVFILLIATSLYSESLLSVYKNKGIKSVEKKLDLGLTSDEFWQEELKDQDTRFGYYEDANTVLVCDKSKGVLNFYTKQGDNKFYLRKAHNAYTGKQSGDKFEEGDLKTPIGVYEIPKKIVSLDQFYGPLAFATSYPNLYDKIRGKNGHGIWIHGLPLNDEQREKYTQGCIAIENPNIECMDRNLDIKHTVLIITEKMVTQDKKKQLASIIAQLYKWRYDWIYNNFDGYISFYDKDFKKVNGNSLNTFTNYKKRLFGYNDEKSIKIKNLRVVPYPGSEKNLFEINFFEEYKSDRTTFFGNKTLIVYLDNNSHMKIIAED